MLHSIKGTVLHLLLVTNCHSMASAPNALHVQAAMLVCSLACLSSIFIIMSCLQAMRSQFATCCMSCNVSKCRSLHRKVRQLTKLSGCLGICRHDTASNRQATERNLREAGYGTQCTASGASSEPCYLQLDMRNENDTRLASVYKPDRRAKLEAQGYTIAGSLGDQWSDLAGTSPAVASFKLPNPMYYIL